ncbi:hypothetical protein CONLIGDRAFT_698979, partial [Coniochaeta ligniaria NRRL 30616]
YSPRLRYGFSLSFLPLLASANLSDTCSSNTGVNRDSECAMTVCVVVPTKESIEENVDIFSFWVTFSSTRFPAPISGRDRLNPPPRESQKLKNTKVRTATPPGSTAAIVDTGCPLGKRSGVTAESQSQTDPKRNTR